MQTNHPAETADSRGAILRGFGIVVLMLLFFTRHSVALCRLTFPAAMTMGLP